VNDARPWSADLAAAATFPDLEALWRRHTSDESMAAAVDWHGRANLPDAPDEIMARMRVDWEARAQELRAAAPPPGTTREAFTSREALEEIDTASRLAVEEYARALNEFGTAHSTYKRERAKAYLRVKAAAAATGEKLTNGEADMMVDADDTVAELHLRAEIAEGAVKATRARLDHIERQFQYHRSLMVRESRVDSH
jgi:hypothetical protein